MKIDDVVEDHVPSPVVGILDGGQQFVVCGRRSCAFHAGDVTTDEGSEAGACGRPSVTWDGDEGECKDFTDPADMRPGDLEMGRQMIPGVGAIGPWSYRVKGEEVVVGTFLEASGKVEGLDPGFQDAVRELAKNEMAPEVILSPLEEAMSSRDRSLDIQTIVEASKDAKPGDAIVFDDMTGKARAMDQDLALAGGARPYEGVVGFKDGPTLPREGPRLVGEIRGEEWVVSPLDTKKALDWLMNIIEPSVYGFVERLNQPALMKGTIEKSLVGRDIGIGVITEADANLETGVCDVTIELHSGEPQSVFHVSFRTPEKQEHPIWAGKAEKGPEGEIVKVETPEEFIEKFGMDLVASPEPELLEVDGVVVEVDSMPGELKESVPAGEVEDLIMKAIIRDRVDELDRLYFGEALKEVRCSDCSCRPQGIVVVWDVDYPLEGKMKPPCLGKKKWLGINRACRHFINVDADTDYQGGEGFDEDDWNDSDWDRDIY